MLVVIVGGGFVLWMTFVFICLWFVFGPPYFLARAKTPTPEDPEQYAATFYEEVERQLAILEGKPDPIKVMKVRRAVPQLAKGEVWLTKDKAHVTIDGAMHSVAMQATDTPLQIARKLLFAVVRMDPTLAYSPYRTPLKAAEQALKRKEADWQAYLNGELEPWSVRHGDQASVALSLSPEKIEEERHKAKVARAYLHAQKQAEERRKAVAAPEKSGAELEKLVDLGECYVDPKEN
jgi:hypothetical protein